MKSVWLVALNVGIFGSLELSTFYLIVITYFFPSLFFSVVVYLPEGISQMKHGVNDDDLLMEVFMKI